MLAWMRFGVNNAESVVTGCRIICRVNSSTELSVRQSALSGLVGSLCRYIYQRVRLLLCSNVAIVSLNDCRHTLTETI